MGNIHTVGPNEALIVSGTKSSILQFIRSSLRGGTLMRQRKSSRDRVKVKLGRLLPPAEIHLECRPHGPRNKATKYEIAEDPYTRTFLLHSYTSTETFLNSLLETTIGH